MWELLTLRPPWEGMDPFQLPVRASPVAAKRALSVTSLWQGLVGFKNQRLPLPVAPPPDCPPMYLQIIREVTVTTSVTRPPPSFLSRHIFFAQCFSTDPAKRPRFDAVQRNLLIMVQQQQQQQQQQQLRR